MPGIGRLVHTRDKDGHCVPLLVTKVWDSSKPDYIQGTAFLDMVNDWDVDKRNDEPKGLHGCSSITPSSLACGDPFIFNKNHTAIAVAEGIPAEDNYAAWEYPFQRWHWPAKTDN